jgi:uncharacterized membrane protein
MFLKNISDIALLAVIFMAVDLGFLRILIPFWNKQLMQVQGSGLSMNYLAAGLSYLTLTLGLYYFIIRTRKPVVEAMLIGWFVYFVYELTNKAIITNWNWTTVLIDGLWGGISFGLTTWLFYYVKAKLKQS